MYRLCWEKIAICGSFLRYSVVVCFGARGKSSVFPPSIPSFSSSFLSPAFLLLSLPPLCFTLSSFPRFRLCSEPFTLVCKSSGSAVSVPGDFDEYSCDALQQERDPFKCVSGTLKCIIWINMYQSGSICINLDQASRWTDPQYFCSASQHDMSTLSATLYRIAQKTLYRVVQDPRESTGGSMRVHRARGTT